MLAARMPIILLPMDASRVGVKTIEVSRENLAKQNRRYLAPAKHFRSRAPDDQTPETAAAPDFHSSRRQTALQTDGDP